MIKITSQIEKDGVEISVDDSENNLGFKFFAPSGDWTSAFGLEKIFKTIADYINLNYICQHEKRINGITYLETK